MRPGKPEMAGRLRAWFKYALSFFKRHWQLDDYPVSIERQPGSEAQSGIPPWKAQIIGWWLVGLGDSPQEVREQLRQNLEAARANGPLSRPGTTPPLTYASTGSLDRHGDFAYEFITEVTGIHPAFMSDGTALADFCGPEKEAEVHARIMDRYGVRSEEYIFEPLWKLLDAAAEKQARS